MEHKGEKCFLGEYKYAGSKWCCEVWADDFDDAKRKFRAMAGAEVVGERMAVIPVPTAFQRLISWLTRGGGR